MKEIDKSKFIDFNKSQGSKKCMICDFFYFSDGFRYQPFVCNGCHGFNMTVQKLSDFFILTIKKIDYRVYIVELIKEGAMAGTYFRDIYSGVNDKFYKTVGKNLRN